MLHCNGHRTPPPAHHPSNSLLHTMWNQRITATLGPVLLCKCFTPPSQYTAYLRIHSISWQQWAPCFTAAAVLLLQLPCKLLLLLLTTCCFEACVPPPPHGNKSLPCISCVANPCMSRYMAAMGPMLNGNCNAAAATAIQAAAAAAADHLLLTGLVSPPHPLHIHGTSRRTCISWAANPCIQRIMAAMGPMLHGRCGAKGCCCCSCCESSCCWPTGDVGAGVRRKTRSNSCISWCRLQR
jgi:hypothetical protein